MDRLGKGLHLMAEMLLRVVDKINDTDPVLDAHCTKRGDVIVICPDGWPWSATERTNPDWKIVKVPGVAVDALTGFLAEEPGDHQVNPKLRRRGKTFDVQSWAGAGSLDLSLVQALALMSTKATVVDSKVIG